MIPNGLSGATMIVSRLVAKITGSLPLRAASVSLVMLAVSAEANTSAGAPSVICCTSAEEASKLNVAVASGLAAVNASPTSVNDSVSDAAANTVMSPSTPAGAVLAGASVVVAAVVAGSAVVSGAAVVAGAAAAALVDAASSSSSPQAAASKAKAATGTRSRRDALVMTGTVVRSSA